MAHSDRVGQSAGKEKSQQLRKREHCHKATAYPPQHVMRSLLLHQCLRRNNNEGDRKADSEHAHASEPRRLKQRQHKRRERQAKQSAQRHIFLREPFGHRIYNLRAQDESDTDHRTDDSEGSRPRVKLVTHIDRDQWAKAAKHKHRGHHRDHDEGNRRMRQDEPRPSRVILPQRTHGFLCCILRVHHAHDCDRREHRSREEKAGAVQIEARIVPKPVHQQTRRRRGDDTHRVKRLDISAFADISPFTGTSVRNVTDCDGPKKLDTVLTRKNSTYICSSRVTKTKPRISAARIRSLMIIVRFTFQRSTNTPASGPTMAMGIMKAIITFVTCNGVPFHLNVMRLITPKTARKSPRILTSFASHSRLKPEILRTSRSERGTGEPAAVADTLGPPRKRLIPNTSRIRPAAFMRVASETSARKQLSMDS